MADELKNILDNYVTDLTNFWVRNKDIPSTNIEILKVANSFPQVLQTKLTELGYEEPETHKIIGKATKAVADRLEEKGLSRLVASSKSI